MCLLGCERITPTILPETRPLDTQPLTLMTYNVYVGADMEALLSLTNLVEVPGAVAGVYEAFMATDFPGRRHCGSYKSTSAAYHQTSRDFIRRQYGEKAQPSVWGFV